MCKAGPIYKTPSGCKESFADPYTILCISSNLQVSFRLPPKLLKYQMMATRLCLVLEASSLDILGGNDGVEVHGALLGGTDLGFGVGIELLALVDVKVDGVGPGNEEEGQGDNHGALGADAVCDVAKNDGDDGTTGDRGNKEGSTTLGVTTETTESCSELDEVLRML